MTAPVPVTDQAVADALRALGATRDEVTQTLLAGGHRGQREACRKCPVARYLQAMFPSVTVEVGITLAVVTGHEPRLAVVMPDPVIEWIDYFDEGAYPELDEAVAA